MAKLNGLILPSEHPPRRSSIKRQLLFFDSVLLPDPSDAALLNRGEVRERFPNGMEMAWGPRTPFPRAEGYIDTLEEIRRETVVLQSKGKLRFLSTNLPEARLHAGPTWTAYTAAISQPALVRAAVPECSDAAPPFAIPAGLYTGGEVAPTGQRSAFSADVGPASNLPGDVHDRWDAMAWSRIGRTIKYVRRATAEHAHPIAFDEPTSNILISLASAGMEPTPTTQEVADLAIATDVVDAEQLDRALQDASWAEVLRLRKEILPHVAKLRSLIKGNVRAAQRHASTDLGAYRLELSRLRDQYSAQKEALVAEWAKLKILGSATGVLAAGATVPVLSTESAIVLPTTFSNWMIGLIAAGLVLGAKVARDVAACVVAKSKLRKHPLFYFDGLARGRSGRLSS